MAAARDNSRHLVEPLLPGAADTSSSTHRDEVVVSLDDDGAGAADEGMRRRTVAGSHDTMLLAGPGGGGSGVDESIVDAEDDEDEDESGNARGKGGKGKASAALQPPPLDRYKAQAAIGRAFRRLNGGYSWTKLASMMPGMARSLAEGRGSIYFLVFMLAAFTVEVVALGNTVRDGREGSVTCLPGTCATLAVPTTSPLGKFNDTKPYQCEVASGENLLGCVYLLETGEVSLSCADICPRNPSNPHLPGTPVSPELANSGLRYVECLSIATGNNQPGQVDTFMECFYNCTEADRFPPRPCADVRQPVQGYLTGSVTTGLIFVMIITYALEALIMLHFRKYKGLWAPFTPAMVLSSLFKGLEVGTFMVSYSWGARDDEQCSSALVHEVVSFFPSCWWDKERLLPGSHVNELCVRAAKQCEYAFVFISFNYLRSAICQRELSTLRQVPGRVLAFVHSDVAESLEGQDLLEQLRVEGHRCCIVYPSLSMLDTMKESLTQMMATKPADTKMQRFVFGEDRLAPAHYFLQMMALEGYARKFFRRRTPAVNEYWRATAGVVSYQPTLPLRLLLVLLRPVGSVAILVVVGASVGLVVTAIILELIVCLLFLTMFARIYEILDTRFRSALPHVAHLLIVLHRFCLITASAEGIRQHRSGRQRLRRAYKDKYDEPAVDMFTLLWHMKRRMLGPTELENPPIPVHITAPRWGTQLRMLEDAGVLRLVRLGEHADFSVVNLDSLSIPELADMVQGGRGSQRTIFWTTSQFPELHSEVRTLLGNNIVATGQPIGGPDLETLLCQLLVGITELSDPAGITVGKHKWVFKKLQIRQ